MPTRDATAVWEGTLQEGNGKIHIYGQDRPYSFKSRFEEGEGTNPEELIAAAHAGCYSMALSGRLAREGFPATRIQSTAKVHLTRGEAGFSISQIDLETAAEVPGITNEKFQELALGAKEGCPVSVALKAVTITLNARLVS
ncbi:MAG TPA: OsmC family protein [Phototrophicaceae bacterium]|nr:OsmC family protein [Phototrophicaceae bacterium]